MNPVYERGADQEPNMAHLEIVDGLQGVDAGDAPVLEPQQQALHDVVMCLKLKRLFNL